MLPAVLVLAACGGSSTDHCANDSCACTPEAQHVTGTPLTFTQVGLSTGGSCASKLLASSADVAAAFPGGDAPPEVMNANFSADRIVLGISNPALEFAVDDGAQLVVGDEMWCQGAAPECTAYIIHGTTRPTFRIAACPYTGPDPCLVP
jgi:hypothetical protein